MPEESIVHPVLFTLDFVLFVIAFRKTSLGKLAEITIPMFFLSAFHHLLKASDSCLKGLMC